MTPAASERRQALLAYCHDGLSLAAEAGYRSFDPFDALACRFGHALFRASHLGARLAVQGGRWTGVRPRRALGIAQRTEAKAVGDLLAASCLIGEHEVAGEAEGFPDVLVGLLLRLGVRTPNGRGWGLSFPCASRFVRAEEMTPNAYTTVCVASALLDAASRLGRDDLVDAGVEALTFLTNDLGWIRRPRGGYLRYWPGSDAPITNVQALAATLFARVAATTGETQFGETGQSLVRTVLNTQRADGSWRYSEDGAADFVDSFHTGFVLEGLRGFLPYAGPDMSPVIEAALALGYAYFRSHLLDTKSGLPLATSDGRRTTDPQSVAQCAQTLAVSGVAGDLECAWRTFAHFPSLERERLIDSRGFSPNSLLSLRWHIGPAVLAAARMSAQVEQAVVTGCE